MLQNFFAEYGVWIAAMALTGLVGGLISGLLGVGGGIVVVPVLYVVLGVFEVAEPIRMKIAVATSLATIAATAWSSANSHFKRGAIDFTLLKTWGPSIFVGVVVGTMIAGAVDGRVLTLVFAVMALLVALNMIFRAARPQLAERFPNVAVKALLGTFVGLVSAMMGIGGGTLSVPILTAFGYDIRRAVGTAAAIGFIIAIPATIGFVIAGWSAANLPPFSLGFVNVAAFVSIVPLSILTAPLGAKIAHAIPRHVLSYGFGAFLAVTSLKMFQSLIS